MVVLRHLINAELVPSSAMQQCTSESASAIRIHKASVLHTLLG
jgi:hypothetical protein